MKFASLLILAVLPALALASVCTYSDKSVSYDLTPMHQANTDYNYTIFGGSYVLANPCGPINTYNCVPSSIANPAATLVSHNQCKVLGNRLLTNGLAYIDSSKPQQGLFETFTSGDSCGNGNTSVTFIYKCSFYTSPGQIVNFTNSDPCAATITINSKYACGIAIPNNQPSSGNNGLSGGSVFVIIFFVLTFVYVVGGCSYNYATAGLSGVEACPNIGFWRTLGGYVSDGFRYFVNLVSCKKSGSESYDSI